MSLLAHKRTQAGRRDGYAMPVLNNPQKISGKKKPFKLERRYPHAAFGVCQQWSVVGRYATRGQAEQAQESFEKGDNHGAIYRRDEMHHALRAEYRITP